MKKLLLVGILAMLATACAKKESKNESANIANPASVYCESIGGKSVIVDGTNGSYGVCHLPDGRIIEEWQLYRANHK